MNAAADKKIKIVRVIARLNTGGPAIHTTLLSGELNKDRFETVLVHGPVGRGEGDMGHLAQRYDLETVLLPSLGRELDIRADVSSFFALVKMMREKKPHIVHTHTAKAGTLGRLAAFFCGVPVRIHTFHGHVFHGYFGSAKSRLFLLIEKALSLITTRIIFLSCTQEEELAGKLKICSKKKAVVIPLGFDIGHLIDCARHAGAFKKELGLPQDTKIVGIVGRLVKIKDHKTFFDAVRLLLKDKKYADVKFLVVGDGDLRYELDDYVHSLGIKRSVIFTGWVKDMAKLYADIDILALTSRNEGTPVSIIEAMLAAKPVVSTRVGGVPDILEDGKSGFLAAPGDSKALSGYIARLLDDEGLRMAMGKAGRVSAKEKFSKERLVRDVEDLYEGCIKEKGVKI